MMAQVSTTKHLVNHYVLKLIFKDHFFLEPFIGELLKKKEITLTFSNNPMKYFIENFKIISFKDYVDKVTRRAAKMLGFIIRISRLVT